ncbi:ferredoxin [Embleya sp. NPDC056575]|uniref:ferredoxin n=1 Tax=unclassified Embleya TaxID=2699296 RepID=UPI00368FCFA9
MKVIVDADRCRDHGQCVFSAPEVFRINDAGRLEFVAEPDDTLRDAVEDAALVCPLQAITIED